ncbi:LOW QUALITY PROTEIN: Hypothetical protein PHPALM_14640 [Phytophthora palmivora]|uniref:Uncharacterized protein n=1 Tax=Phytophthora palmivora TaxID=4796 RepID=A0A2P4XU52_9STRA|nr:LOW QUALITY PROTEIN: Hypothetical protein PHPALM_14640 [Phytophthora palmivora]
MLAWTHWKLKPPLWRAPISKQQKSDAKQLVAYMKLFLDDGFILDTTEASYRDQVLSLGTRAEKSVLMFLEEHNIISRGSGWRCPETPTLHRAGALNTKIERHEQLLQTPAIQDPAPGYGELTWVDEADLNCGALLYDYLRDRTNRNRFEVMQSHEKP